jgi:hypothetical protein
MITTLLKATEECTTVLGDNTVSEADLEQLERACISLAQAIRRIRGRAPLMTEAQARKTVQRADLTHRSS